MLRLAGIFAADSIKHILELEAVLLSVCLTYRLQTNCICGFHIVNYFTSLQFGLKLYRSRRAIHNTS